VPRGNVKNLKVGKPGVRNGGRQKGTTNVFTREIKEAIFTAAELCKSSHGKGLVGYLTDLADNRKDLYVHLLGRMIPVQQKTSVDLKIVAKTEVAMSPQELMEYYQKLRQYPAGAPPLQIEHQPTDEVEVLE
jgi:hypothetical protein